MNKETLMPLIRFSGFTGTWENNKLGDLGSVAMCKRIFKEQTSENGDIPFFKIGTFGKKADAFIPRAIFEEYKEKYSFPELGDILISASGTIGRAVVYKGEDSYFQDSNIIWFKRDKKLINNSFLKQFYEIVKWAGLEGSTIKRLYNSNILSTKINLPKLEEQTKIGEFFEQLDKIITLQQQLLNDHKQLKKAMLQKMFPQKGESVPRIRFAGFTDNWENKEIKDMFEVTRGKVLAATKVLNKKTRQFQYPVYSSQTKNNGLLGFYKEYLFDTAITWTTDGANAGTVNFREGKFYSTNVNGVLLSKEGYANKAVSEILNRIAWKFVSKVGNPKLMNNIMSDISIVVPSLEEQLKISNFFNQLDETIALHENKLETYQELKKAMLQKMFV